jgi:MFS transporter, DHA3 family, macrolide efflux protein
MFRLLRDPRFGLLTLGHALNGIGSWTSLIAVWGYAAYQFELGPAHLSLLVLAWGLPPVLLGPAAGLLIDRIGPRPVAVTADLANAAVALAMIASADLATLLALTVLHGIGKAFAAPAYAALLPRAVPPDRLFDANAVFTAAADLAMVLGPVVAAGVIATAGTAAAFAVDAATYLIGAAATLPLSLHPVPAARHEPVPAAGHEPSSGTWAQLHAGLRAVRTSTGTKQLFTLGFGLWLTFGTFLVLEPVFVRDVLNQPVTTFALLQTAFGVGLVGTGTALSSLRRYLESTSRMGPVIFTAGVAAAVYAATPVLAVTFAASAAWGFCVALFSAPSRTLLLQQTPAEVHGRVLGAWQAANSLGQLLPALAFPVLAGIGTQASLVGCGVLLAVVGLAARVAYPRSPGPPERQQAAAPTS